MNRMIAFLCGVNVGGNNRIAMTDLRRVLDGLGHTEVATLLQSGNAVFTCRSKSTTAVAAGVERALGDELGLNVRVVVRTVAELRAALLADPLTDVASDPARHFIGFLAEPPDPSGVSALSATPLGSDRAAVVDRHVYLWCPGGYSKSPLFKFPWERRFGTVVTMRNLRTAAAVLDLG